MRHGNIERESYKMEGDQPSIGFLRKAVDLDRENTIARGFLDDFVAMDPGDTQPQIGFKGKLGKAPKGTKLLI